MEAGIQEHSEKIFSTKPSRFSTRLRAISLQVDFNMFLFFPISFYEV
jgi:hypothetical protein